MLQKNAITEVPPDSPGVYSNIFLVCKASEGWHPVTDLRRLNAHIFAPHFRMFTISSLLSTVRKGDYMFKIDLQDAYFYVPIQPSIQVSLVCFQKQILSYTSTSLWSEHSPSGVYSFRTHCGRLPPSSGDFSYSIPQRLVSSPSSSTLPSVSAIEHARPGALYFKQKEVLAGSSAGYPVSWYSVTSGSGESLTPGIQGSGDNSMCMRHILPTSILISTSVPVHGITQFGFRSHPSGSSAPKAITASLSFFESDKPVYTTASIRPVGPCHPTSAVA